VLNAIRKELRRFEKRRLRPVLHMFRRSSSRAASEGFETRAESASLGHAAMEQLLVAMLREQVRGATPGTARPAGSDSSDLDSFVRGMLAVRPHDVPGSNFPEAA
jgi:hypothetical protein